MNYGFELSKEEVGYVNNLYNSLWKNCKEELSVKENMVLFYLKCFPEENKADAEVLVDRIIGAVSTFNKYFEEANENSEEWIDEKIDEATKDLTEPEKYGVMLNLLIAIRAVDTKIIEDNLKTEGFEWKSKFDELMNSEFNINESEITAEKINEIKEMIKEAMKNSSISIAGNSNIVDLVNELKENKDSVKDFVESNWNYAEFKNYSALAAYIAYLQGATPSIPENTEPEIIALGVAAGIERNEIINQASMGKITWEVAVKVLKIITFSALICIMALVSIKFIAMSVLVGGTVFYAITSGAIFAFISGMILGGYLGCQVIMQLCEIGKKGVSILSEGYDKTIDLITVGYKKTSEYIKDSLWPYIKEQLARLWIFIEEKIISGILNTTLTTKPKLEEKIIITLKS